MITKKISNILLTLIILNSFILTCKFTLVNGQFDTIKIKSDGNIEPSSAPIIIENSIYKLTEDIEATVIIERDNIIIDGNNKTIIGDQINSGIELNGRNNVTIRNFQIKNCSEGIKIIDSNNNTIASNTILSNNIGISLTSSSNNKIYHNNFVDNTHQAQVDFSINIWDLGYPPGGNYWSDNPEQQHLMDGIGITTYRINDLNIDEYPFIYPYKTVYSGLWGDNEYLIDIVSNSSISNFHFNPSEGAFVSFDITGEPGTFGFCRISFPYQLLSTEDHDWTVSVGNEAPLQNEIYNDVLSSIEHVLFIYENGEKTVRIEGTQVIPEFFSLNIFLSLITVTSIIIILIKRKTFQVPK